MTATALDGKATRDEIFVDLAARVATLREAGVTPGLGTVLANDEVIDGRSERVRPRPVEDGGPARVREAEQP